MYLIKCICIFESKVNSRNNLFKKLSNLSKKVIQINAILNTQIILYFDVNYLSDSSNN